MNSTNTYAPFQTLAWIDDSSDAHTGLIACLKDAGYNVQAESTPARWLKQKHTILPCIIILRVKAEDNDLAATVSKLKSQCNLPGNIGTEILGVFDSMAFHRKIEFIEAGGIACLTEPLGEQELLHSVSYHCKRLKEKFDTQAQINEASQMAILAMENSSDLGGIINFIKKAIGAKHYEELAQELFRSVELHCENCLIEISGHSGQHYFAAEKHANNLINSVLDKDMLHYLLNQKQSGRLIKLDNILQINQSNIVILLDGVPTKDELRMERISDALVILSDVANRFAQSLSVEENLRKAETERQAFLNTLSHELRTPLNGVIGFSKTLASKADHGTVNTSSSQEALRQITEGAEQINAIISTLLEISSYDSSPTTHEKIDIESLFILLKNRFQTLAEKKSLAFSMQAPHGLQIFSHPSKVLNVLSHLIDNAIKFTDQGKIEVDASIDSRPDMGQHVIIKVSDTGIGISPDDHQRIFTEIGQLNKEHNRKHYGMGLGLYYAYLVTRQLGGELSLESALGQGSRFYLRLPLSEQSSKLSRDFRSPPLADNINDSVLF